MKREPQLGDMAMHMTTRRAGLVTGEARYLDGQRLIWISRDDGKPGEWLPEGEFEVLRVKDGGQA